MAAARERALDGHPVFVEALTYRVEAHTTSDDPSRYRDDAEVEQWRERDPIERYQRFLEAEGLWAEVDDDAIVEEIDQSFDAAIEEANAFEEREVAAIFEHVFEETPPGLAKQLSEFETLLSERPETYDHVEQRPKG
jgi:pyruvate dehydrogenase E1 component alpha subunit